MKTFQSESKYNPMMAAEAMCQVIAQELYALNKDIKNNKVQVDAHALAECVVTLLSSLKGLYDDTQEFLGVVPFGDEPTVPDKHPTQTFMFYDRFSKNYTMLTTCLSFAKASADGKIQAQDVYWFLRAISSKLRYMTLFASLRTVYAVKHVVTSDDCDLFPEGTEKGESVYLRFPHVDEVHFMRHYPALDSYLLSRGSAMSACNHWEKELNSIEGAPIFKLSVQSFPSAGVLEGAKAFYREYVGNTLEAIKER